MKTLIALTPEAKALEMELPLRCRHWLADAYVNEESVGDAGADVIEHLKRRERWDDDRACAVVNELLAAYGDSQRYISHREMARTRALW